MFGFPLNSFQYKAWIYNLHVIIYNYTSTPLDMPLPQNYDFKQRHH